MTALTVAERAALYQRRAQLAAVLQATKDELRSIDFQLSRDRQHRAALLAASSKRNPQHPATRERD